MWRIRSRGPQPYRNNSCDCDGYQAKPRCQFYPCLNGSAHLAGFAFSPTATTFKGSFSFVALRRIAVCVRLSFLAMVAISFEASIDDRSSSSSSGVHKILRGTITSPSPLTPARQAGIWNGNGPSHGDQPWRTGAANPSRFPSGQSWG